MGKNYKDLDGGIINDHGDIMEESPDTMINKIEKEVNEYFPDNVIVFKLLSDMGYIIEVDGTIMKTRFSKEIEQDLNKMYNKLDLVEELIIAVVREIRRELNDN